VIATKINLDTNKHSKDYKKNTILDNIKTLILINNHRAIQYISTPVVALLKLVAFSANI